jgi:hypothetical protein
MVTHNTPVGGFQGAFILWLSPGSRNWVPAAAMCVTREMPKRVARVSGLLRVGFSHARSPSSNRMSSIWMGHAANAGPLKCDPVLVSLERRGRVQSRAPIRGPDQAILALDPSANRKSFKLAKYILLLPQNEDGNLYTNQARRLVSPCFTAGSCRLPACLPTQRQRNGRPSGETKCLP